MKTRRRPIRMFFQREDWLALVQIAIKVNNDCDSGDLAQAPAALRKWAPPFTSKNSSFGILETEVYEIAEYVVSRAAVQSAEWKAAYPLWAKLGSLTD